MKKISTFLKYTAATLLGLLGLHSPKEAEAKRYEVYLENISEVKADAPIYLERRKFYLQNGDFIDSQEEMDLAHRSHSSHSSHRSHYSGSGGHYSHRSHTSHYSASGGGGGYSSPNRVTPRVTPSPANQVVDTMPILSVQKILNLMGYECGKEDGKKGKTTTAAIKKFQSDFEISQTGIIANADKTILESFSFSNVQEKLIEQGHLVSKDIDGVRDASTINAIKKFQTEKKIASNGILNKKTLNALNIELGTQNAQK
jgi:hypothetical protein